MLSFILNDFYSCTGYFSYLTSAISTNVWLLSASLYDTSIYKHILAGLNLFRTTSFLLFNDDKCKYSPKFGKKLANSRKPQVVILVAAIQTISSLFNGVTAILYFSIDDYLSSKMAWVLTSSAVSHLFGYESMII